MMILGHNKSILIYLHDKIEEQNIASVGYYVGGMKERDLKQSETKQIIIATYKMAEEGLDIKTLTTLMMITPKTDVCQAVGRILRKKGEKHIIYDIVDQHGIFQRQWVKRKRYYKKQNYTIMEITSNNFANKKWSISLPEEKSKHKLHIGKCLIEDE